MDIFVNGELVPPELIEEERNILIGDEGFQQQTSGLSAEERGERLTEQAETGAIDRVLIAQEMRKDERPVNSAILEREVKRVQSEIGCRPGFSEESIRRGVELDIRTARALQSLAGQINPPSSEEIVTYFQAHQSKFRAKETVTASHIVKHVDELCTGNEARQGIAEAYAALDRGESFTVRLQGRWGRLRHLPKRQNGARIRIGGLRASARKHKRDLQNPLRFPHRAGPGTRGGRPSIVRVCQRRYRARSLCSPATPSHVTGRGKPPWQSHN